MAPIHLKPQIFLSPVMTNIFCPALKRLLTVHFMIRPPAPRPRDSNWMKSLPGSMPPMFMDRMRYAPRRYAPWMVQANYAAVMATYCRSMSTVYPTPVVLTQPCFLPEMCAPTNKLDWLLCIPCLCANITALPMNWLQNIRTGTANKSIKRRGNWWGHKCRWSPITSLYPHCSAKTAWNPIKVIART